MAKAKVAKLMKNLGISEEDALKVIAADKAIDQGAKLFELDEEQQKAAKAATICCEGIHKATSPKRERKPDVDKKEIMDTIDDALCCLVDNVLDRTNDRELFFEYNDKKYKITLSCPRN